MVSLLASCLLKQPTHRSYTHPPKIPTALKCKEFSLKYRIDLWPPV